MRLVELIAHLEKPSFDALVKRRGVVIDTQKRVPITEQVARAIVSPPELFALARDSEETASALRLLARAPHGLPRTELGAALLPLVEAGVVFRSPRDSNVFVLPSAYRVQLAETSADDPRALRLGLPKLDDESLRLLANHILGRAPQGARALVEGEILTALETDGRIEKEMSTLAPRERTIFEAILSRGGEVDLEELQRVAQDSSRQVVLGERGMGLSRRSHAFPLMCRGLLLPHTTETFAIPAEAARVIGFDFHAEIGRLRDEVVSRVASFDLAPARAQFAVDAGPSAIALFAALRASGSVLKPNAGAPRSVLRSATREAGVEPDIAEMLVALGRSAGITTRTLRIDEIGAALVHEWRRGVAWDEARLDPDRHRVQDKLARIATPTRSVIETMIELLGAFPPGRFVLRTDLVALVTRDLRVFGAARRFERVIAREGTNFVKSLDELVTRIIAGSLWALGLVDFGKSDRGDVLRLSAQARKTLFGTTAAPTGSATAPAEKLGRGRFLLARSVGVSSVLGLSDFATTYVVDGKIAITLDESSLERGFERGLDDGAALRRLSRVGIDVVDEDLALIEAGLAPRLAAEVSSVSAFVRIESESDVERLRAVEGFDELFLPIAIANGLLVRESVSAPRLQRFLRTNGIGVR